MSGLADDTQTPTSETKVKGKRGGRSKKKTAQSDLFEQEQSSTEASVLSQLENLLVSEAHKKGLDKMARLRVLRRSFGIPLSELREAMSKLVDFTKVDTQYIEVFDSLLRSNEVVNPTVRIHINNHPTPIMQGHYDPNDNAITMHTVAIGRELSDTDLVRMMAHEMAHSITKNNLDTHAFSTERAILQDGIQQLKDAIQTADTSMLTPSELFILNYATKNEHELLVVSMTDTPAVKNFIQKHINFAKLPQAKKYTLRSKNPLAVLKAIFKNLLGLNNNSFKVYETLVNNITSSPNTVTRDDVEDVINTAYLREKN